MEAEVFRELIAFTKLVHGESPELKCEKAAWFPEAAFDPFWGGLEGRLSTHLRIFRGKRSFGGGPLGILLAIQAESEPWAQDAPNRRDLMSLACGGSG